MKKILSGIGFLFTGAFLYATACIAGALNYPNTTEWEIGRAHV